MPRQFGDDNKAMPTLVPIMIGNTSGSFESTLGKLLAPYLADPETAFVISSDFAHWGTRFRYTYYRAASGAITNLGSSSRSPKQPEIHESIKAVDLECMGACESGSHAKWLDILEETGNTVCGRHPIGVIMAAIEQVRKDTDDPSAGAFKFLRYERSSEVRHVSESSVSYASAIAVI
jgi:AmmeMemoRadiSam system protein B